MKKRLIWRVGSLLLAFAVLALGYDDYRAHAALVQWESSAKPVMDEMWVAVQIGSDVPIVLPEDPPERLHALGEKISRRLDHYRVKLAIAEAQLGGYYDPHAHPGED